MRFSRANELRFEDLPGRRSANPFPDHTEVSVRVVEVEPGPRSPHRHPAAPEVVYVARGQGLMWQDGEQRTVQAGDVGYVPRGVAHATVASDYSALTLICFFPRSIRPEDTEELKGFINCWGQLW